MIFLRVPVSGNMSFSAKIRLAPATLKEKKIKKIPQELNSFCWTSSHVATHRRNNSGSVQRKLCPKVCDFYPKNLKLLERVKQAGLANKVFSCV